MNREYDCLIIGAGMSGLAAGIRLGLFGKKTLILEKHRVPGGLNSYYKRKSHLLDVGLHALTNFAKKGQKGPLNKIFRQLRVSPDAFLLSQQTKSIIHFPSCQLNFTNQIEDLIESIENNFPDQIDGFLKLVMMIRQYDAFSLEKKFSSAKEVIKTFLSNDLLKEMIFTPPLIYGSAWENDMDFSQFAIMFRALYLEGLSRPEGGVRRIIDILQERLKDLEVPIEYGKKVKKILVQKGVAWGVQLENGEIIKAKKILCSAGLPETMELVEGEQKTYPTGRLSFTESILVLKEKPADFNIDTTLIFFNNQKSYKYERPESLVNFNNAVVCLPNNFAKDSLPEGMIRITHMANYPKWCTLERREYLQNKEHVFEKAMELVKTLFPHFDFQLEYKDVFTPKTIKRYTDRKEGAVYGSPHKLKDGTTDFKNLFICGTDQGFLGVIGAMLSGISMANKHVLMEKAT
jgi:phytoene dehydrogenase-like protein